MEIFKRDDGVLDINLENRYYSDESDSDSESENTSSITNKKSTSPNIDAETSDD